jgi:hypothetical protein
MEKPQVIEKDGRPVETRTPDLYRVNVDLKPDKQGKNRLERIARSLQLMVQLRVAAVLI